MAQEIYDLDPAEHLTVDVIDEENDRIFLLQGQSGDSVVTLLIDQEQAVALSLASSELLDILAESFPREINPFAVPSPDTMSCQKPIHPLFQVAQFQLGYDDTRDETVIISIELPPDDELEAEDLRIVRFWISREQLVALVRQIEHIIDTYIPICPACGEPIKPDGHRCVRDN
jgi:uncharacterized repeat protein (TIGR03847 family)